MQFLSSYNSGIFIDDAINHHTPASPQAVTDTGKSGEPIPVALAEKNYSDEFSVRIPPELHRSVAMQAAEQGVSLNRLASSKLAG